MRSLQNIKSDLATTNKRTFIVYMSKNKHSSIHLADQTQKRASCSYGVKTRKSSLAPKSYYKLPRKHGFLLNGDLSLANFQVKISIDRI